MRAAVAGWLEEIGAPDRNEPYATIVRGDRLEGPIRVPSRTRHAAMIMHQHSRSRRLGIAALGHGDRLAAGLGRRLDDGFHHFRGVAPSGMEPIQTVVVGPGGTWALTPTDEHGRFRRRNGHWYRWNRSTESWVPWEAGVITAARMAGHRLALYLERAALSAHVEACLIPGPGMEVTWDPGEQLALHVDADVDRLAALISRDEVLTPAQVDRIVALLDPRQPLPRLAPSAPHG